MGGSTSLELALVLWHDIAASMGIPSLVSKAVHARVTDSGQELPQLVLVGVAQSKIGVK